MNLTSCGLRCVQLHGSEGAVGELLQGAEGRGLLRSCGPALHPQAPADPPAGASLDGGLAEDVSDAERREGFWQNVIRGVQCPVLMGHITTSEDLGRRHRAENGKSKKLSGDFGPQEDCWVISKLLK